jgi:L-amino acid N-acyltransferase YncA
MTLLIDQMLPADWPAVHEVYLEGIATRQATFETTVPSWEAWDASHLPFARLVARQDEIVIGWAALTPASSRQVYAGVAEVSVYVAESQRGLGLGRKLLAALITASEENGIWSLQAGMFPENARSVALHRSLAFAKWGDASALQSWTAFGAILF